MSHSSQPSMDLEMHELNEEADFLDQKTTVIKNGVNGHTHLERHDGDPDAQAMVIGSLRTQIQDLFSQVNQLNSKLVSSYDRVSNLEDELHVTNANLRSSTLKISELELERSQHLSALSTGLLVEKDHVTTELTQLMQRATEEAAQRGQAESARAEIEKELDDLSASLFNQANSMVAEARMAEARSERKVQETERALKGAEEVVGVLQAQMQTLQADKEAAERRADELRVTMGKGKWVARQPSPSRALVPRLLSSHAPYQEYLAFIAHLRTIRPANQHPPAMATLLPQPFLARLAAEDSEPTVRLDLAPSLNWLTRRSVLAAIHTGQLTVEPMATATLLEELTPSVMTGTTGTHIVCALCGALILSPPSSSEPPPQHPARPSMQNTWSTALLKTSNTLVQSMSPKRLSSGPALPPPAQVYIFRLDAAVSGLPAVGTQPRPSVHPLCTTHWCLARLRTTCSLWAFVRTSVVERVWEETPYAPPASAPPSPRRASSRAERPEPTVDGTTPRKARMGLGSLWGSMQRSLSAGVNAPNAEKELPKEPSTDKKAPVPPPAHPSKSEPGATRAVPPPPLPPRNRQRDLTLKPNGSTATVNDVVASKLEQVETGDSITIAQPPISLERSESSQTEFATPGDGPTSFISSRAGTPTDIPLPESKPSTPEPIPAAESDADTQKAAEAGHPADAEPSVAPTEANFAEDSQPPAGEPAPPVTEPDAAATEKPSEEKPAAVPPPLPRRAAARSRPVPPPPADATAPTTFSDTEEKPAEKDVQATSTSEAPVQPAEEPQQPAEETSASITAEPTHSETVVDTGSPATVVSELSVPGESHAEPETEDETLSTEPATESDLAQADETETVTHGSPTPSINGVVDGVEGKSLASRAQSPVEDDDEKHLEDGRGPWVSDATWEERTWKELVRLREEMFWARIGGVR